MIKSKTAKKLSVETYVHGDKKRINNPPVGLVSSSTDSLSISRTEYKHDPHIDPYLSWAGKKESMNFEIPNVSLHIHERIDSKQLVMAFLKKRSRDFQLSFWEDPFKDLPLLKDVQFYQHENGWANRIIAGDSSLVMNSLLQKEGMAGKVQMIYIDPPYGIKYNSNFQPFINKKDVKDNNDADIPGEPEMIQAFRDTWELGIHSYLTYLRDRLLLAKELLDETGSCFVQISDENLHHVRELMEEIFKPNNFVSVITFKKKNMPLGSKLLEQMDDYIIWYTKDKNKIKYHKLFLPMNVEGDSHWNFAEFPDGKTRQLTPEEINNHKLLPAGTDVFRFGAMFSAGVNESGFYDIEVEGDLYRYPKGKGWKTPEESMKKLIALKRVVPWEKGKTLGYKIKLSDFRVTPIHAYWDDTALLSNKIYVVQTSTIAIQKCMLMTTDPGDLVLDPTCGSGTTAFVAEQWGRRWITCDTSRVAIALAKQRLMTAKFEYYELAHPEEGIASGFRYKTFPHITLGSIANNELPKEETLYDQPYSNKLKVRVTGPFTAEAVPSLRTKPFDNTKSQSILLGNMFARTGATVQYIEWMDELKTTGIRTTGNRIISFSRVEPMSGTKYLHAEGEILTEKTVQKAVISFGPDFGPLDQRQVEQAINEAKALKEPPNFIIFTAFHFDPEAAKDIDQINQSIGQVIPGAKALKVQMSVDLLTKDLRKKRSSNQSYWLIGQPDVELVKDKNKTYTVKVNGFDYYNPITGEIDSGSINRIAMWMLDTDYDERSVFPTQVFFPISDAKRDWTKLAKALNGEVNKEMLEAFTGIQSIPFQPGDNKKIAVKIIDDRGIESFVVKSL